MAMGETGKGQASWYFQAEGIVLAMLRTEFPSLSDTDREILTGEALDATLRAGATVDHPIEYAKQAARHAAIKRKARLERAKRAQAEGVRALRPKAGETKPDTDVEVEAIFAGRIAALYQLFQKLPPLQRQIVRGYSGLFRGARRVLASGRLGRFEESWLAQKLNISVPKLRRERAKAIEFMKAESRNVDATMTATVLLEHAVQVNRDSRGGWQKKRTK